MKKLTLGLIAAISALIMCFALAACSSDVAGNTYKFSDVSVSYSDECPEEYKMTDEQIAAAKENYADMSITFNKDGTCVQTWDNETYECFYKQDGKKVYVAETEEDLEDPDECECYEVSGSKISITHEVMGMMSVTITLKK